MTDNDIMFLTGMCTGIVMGILSYYFYTCFMGIALRRSNHQKERIVEMTQSEYDVLKENLKLRYANGVVTFFAFGGSYEKAKDSGYVSVFMNGETLHIKIEEK